MNEGGQTPCRLCAAGKYGTEAAAASSDICIDCAAGWYSGAAGQTHCQLCATGNLIAAQAMSAGLLGGGGAAAACGTAFETSGAGGVLTQCAVGETVSAGYCSSSACDATNDSGACCLGAIWTSKTVTEGSTDPSAPNTITVTLQPSVQLVAGNTVMISGLTGSETADSGSLTVGGADAAKVGSSGVWVQNTGTLMLTVANTVGTGAASVLTFDLVNPGSGQAPVTPQIEASSYGWRRPGQPQNPTTPTITKMAPACHQGMELAGFDGE